jgi:succinyl-diaminopimelate desuccinylase
LAQYDSSLKEGRIYGPGSGDMKGAVAIMLELFRNLQRAHPGISIGLAVTSDEERGGESGVRYLVEEEGLRCGQAIIPDGGSLNELTVEEKGILHLKILSHGHAAHAARPWLGKNALALLLEGVRRVEAYFDRFKPADYDAEGGPVDHWFPTCTLTEVHTDNETVNRIPAEAEAVLDIRFPPGFAGTGAELSGEALPLAADEVREKVASLAGEDLEVETIVSAEPTHLDPDPLFREVTRELTGKPVSLVQASGGSDSRFLRAHDIPVNLSRPLVGDLHAEDEWIDVESMAVYYRICEAYVLRKLGIGLAGEGARETR